MHFVLCVLRKLDKCEITGSNYHHYAGRRSGERYNSESLKPSVKHGGVSVMVWRCISASFVGDLVNTDGIMNTDQMLIHHVMPSGE